MKKTYPNKVYVHRIDGPMRLYNNMEDIRDHIVYALNQEYADATIFQSNWSYTANLEMGMNINKPFSIIPNAPDPQIFNKDYEKKEDDKLKLIATSWSDNVKKGFKYYDFLDKNLDFDKYQFSFVGRSPIKFKNINMLGALSTQEVAETLRNHDVYITASEHDPCSNSLIEALTCGLPVVALNSGGHSELVQNGGLLFESTEDLLDKLEEMLCNTDELRDNISVKTIKDIANEYVSFFEKMNEETK